MNSYAQIKLNVVRLTGKLPKYCARKFMFAQIIVLIVHNDKCMNNGSAQKPVIAQICRNFVREYKGHTKNSN